MKKCMQSLAVTVTCALALAVPSAFAGSAFCVPAKASTTVKSPNAKGECPAENTLTYGVDKEESEALSHVAYKAKGIDEKPTVYVSEANVVVEGASGSGEGNLLVGSQAAGPVATGSNNLVVGNENDFLGELNIIDGSENTAYGKYNALFGSDNGPVGTEAGNMEGDLFAGNNNYAHEGEGESGNDSVLFGRFNEARGYYTSVLGGESNVVSHAGSVVGGVHNTASGNHSSILAGDFNTASGGESVILGGDFNVASGLEAAVVAGATNSATATNSTIVGGERNETYNETKKLGWTGQASVIAGGQANKNEAQYGFEGGGKEKLLTEEFGSTL
jgi:hypothetical protein